MSDITELYCLMDDFCKKFEPELNARLLNEGTRQRLRPCCLSMAELMTLVVLFHQLRYRQFKSFWLNHVCQHLSAEFPGLPSYSRCIELLPRCGLALHALFETLKGKCSGIQMADSTPVAVCSRLRIRRHRVFQGIAGLGKNQAGWFLGFKLHAVINHAGELLSIRLTRGNRDDRTPLPDMVRGLWGRLYADRGYISKTLTGQLKEKGIDLITRARKNMKPAEHTEFDRALLRKRSLIETVFDQLKNLSQIEHTRHRSPGNFIVNLLAGIVAYCLTPCKPKLDVTYSNLQPQNSVLIPN